MMLQVLLPVLLPGQQQQQHQPKQQSIAALLSMLARPLVLVGGRASCRRLRLQLLMGSRCLWCACRGHQNRRRQHSTNTKYKYTHFKKGDGRVCVCGCAKGMVVWNRKKHTSRGMKVQSIRLVATGNANERTHSRHANRTAGTVCRRYQERELSLECSQAPPYLKELCRSFPVCKHVCDSCRPSFIVTGTGTGSTAAAANIAAAAATIVRLATAADARMSTPFFFFFFFFFFLLGDSYFERCPSLCDVEVVVVMTSFWNCARVRPAFEVRVQPREHTGVVCRPNPWRVDRDQPISRDCVPKFPNK